VVALLKVCTAPNGAFVRGNGIDHIQVRFGATQAPDSETDKRLARFSLIDQGVAHNLIDHALRQGKARQRGPCHGEGVADVHPPPLTPTLSPTEEGKGAIAEEVSAKS